MYFVCGLNKYIHVRKLFFLNIYFFIFYYFFAKKNISVKVSSSTNLYIYIYFAISSLKPVKCTVYSLKFRVSDVECNRKCRVHSYVKYASAILSPLSDGEDKGSRDKGWSVTDRLEILYCLKCNVIMIS